MGGGRLTALSIRLTVCSVVVLADQRLSYPGSATSPLRRGEKVNDESFARSIAALAPARPRPPSSVDDEYALPGIWSTIHCFDLVHPMSLTIIIFLMTLNAPNQNNFRCSNFRACDNMTLSGGSSGNADSHNAPASATKRQEGI